MTRTLILGLLLALPTAALAESPPSTTAYLGIGGGSARYGFDSDLCQAQTMTTCEVDGTDTGFKVFAGLRADGSAVVEIAYYDFGALTADVGGGAVMVEEEQSAIALAAAGLLPFSEQAGLLFKAGIYSADLDATATGPGGSATFSDSASGLMLGAGLWVQAANQIGLRVEYEHFSEAGDSETDLGMASASLVVSF